MNRTSISRIKRALLICFIALEITGHKIFIMSDPFAGCRIYYGPCEAYHDAGAPVKAILKGNRPGEELAGFFLKGSSLPQGLHEASPTVMGEAIQRLFNRFRFQSDTRQLLVSSSVNAEMPVAPASARQSVALSPPVPPAAPPQLNI